MWEEHWVPSNGLKYEETRGTDIFPSQKYIPTSNPSPHLSPIPSSTATTGVSVPIQSPFFFSVLLRNFQLEEDIDSVTEKPTTKLQRKFETRGRKFETRYRYSKIIIPSN